MKFLYKGYYLSITEKITETFSFLKKCKKIVQDHLIQRGLALTEYEQKLGYINQIQKKWKSEESMTSKAVTTSVAKKRHTYYYIYDKKRLRTTNAYWPYITLKYQKYTQKYKEQVQ